MILSTIDLSRDHCPGTAPLLELLAQHEQSRRQRMSDRSARARNRARQEGAVVVTRPHAPRRLFLAELEVVGSVQAACEAASCTKADVRRWRAADPMFARDFVLAILAHIRVLKHMLRDVTEGQGGAAAAMAQRLLDSEFEYLGGDGRLDVYRWCAALRALVLQLGLDFERWEPLAPVA